MAVQIGTKPDSGYEDPLGMLHDCHRRIERFLDLLYSIGTMENVRPLSMEEAQAVERALVYFRTAGPKHNADEENSVFPRLRPHLSSTEIEHIERLEKDHDKAAHLHDSVDLIFTSWMTSRELRTKDHQLLQSNLKQLVAIYQEHIKMEEGTVFPLAAKHLNPESIKAIGKEFEQRRK